MKTDSLFYRLFKRMPGLVVELAKLDCPTHGYKFQSQEIKQTSFRLDGVLTPITPGGEQPIIFIEVQFRSDKGFYGRFFSEIFLYLRQYNPPFPWRAVVLYPDRATEQDAGLHFRSLLKLPEVHRVYLEDFLEGVGDSPALRLIKLRDCPETNMLIYKPIYRNIALFSAFLAPGFQ